MTDISGIRLCKLNSALTFVPRIFAVKRQGLQSRIYYNSDKQCLSWMTYFHSPKLLDLLPREQSACSHQTGYLRRCSSGSQTLVLCCPLKYFLKLRMMLTGHLFVTRSRQVWPRPQFSLFHISRRTNNIRSFVCFLQALIRLFRPDRKGELRMVQCAYLSFCSLSHPMFLHIQVS